MDIDRLPAGLPVLRKGSHAHWRQGACLMEYVSVLAGEPFSDHPRCVDRLLVHLGWIINDTAGDEVRAPLPELAPRLIGTAGADPVVAPTLVAACCRYSRPFDGPINGGVLARAEHRAEARLRHLRARPDARRRLSDQVYRLHADLPLIEAARTVAAADPAGLPHLLMNALDALEGLPGPGARSSGPTGDTPLPKLI